MYAKVINQSKYMGKNMAMQTVLTNTERINNSGKYKTDTQ